MSGEQSGQRRMNRRPALLLSILCWVVVFGVLFWLCGVLLTQQWLWFTVPNPDDTNQEFFELLTSVLATIGGIIAISYLVIKYRERSDQERGQNLLKAQQINQDLRAAIEQLGHDKPVVRIAGVHALLDISDEQGGIFKQRIVDVLCGYLRADRMATNDRAVESTILQAIHERTRKEPLRQEDGEVFLPRTVEASQLWCECTFDLHGAIFTEELHLDGSTFNAHVNFAEATFTAPATFHKTAFQGHADFKKSQFHGVAFFIESKFESLDFTNATFYNQVSFIKSVFQDTAIFNGSKFHAVSDFKNTSFHNQGLFNAVEFLHLASFNEAVFHNWATYSWGSFYGPTVFDDVSFRGPAAFNEAVFRHEISFARAEFQTNPQFHQARFNPDYKADVVFPNGVSQKDGLPKGVRWNPPENKAH